MVGKKHDYYQKLINNRRALDNLRIYLKKTQESFEIAQIHLKEKDKQFSRETNEAIKSIADDIHVIESNLNYSDEELMDKINSGFIVAEELFAKKMHSAHPGKKKKKEKKNKSPEKQSSPEKRKLKVYSVEDSLKREKENKAKGLLPQIKSKVYLSDSSKSHTIKKEVGIFNNYGYLAHRSGSPIPQYMQSKSKQPSTVKKEKIKVDSTTVKSKSTERTSGLKNESFISENEERKMLEEHLNYDYGTTTDKHYELLLKRESNLKKISSGIIDNIEESEQIYAKKIEEMEMTIDHNQERLKSLLKVFPI